MMTLSRAFHTPQGTYKLVCIYVYMHVFICALISFLFSHFFSKAKKWKAWGDEAEDGNMERNATMPRAIRHSRFQPWWC